MVLWHKRRWRCQQDYCEHGSFTEAIAQIPPRARTTDAVARPDRRGDRGGSPLGGRGRRSHTACRGRPRIAPSSRTPRWCLVSRSPPRSSASTKPAAVSPAGCAAPRRGGWLRVDPWDTGFVDLAGPQGLLGQGEGRTGAAVIDWLSERSARVPRRASRTWRSTQPPPTPPRSARPGCCPTRRWSSTISTWSSWPTTRSPRCAAGSPGTCATAAAASSTRSGPTGAGCCGPGTLVGQEFRQDVERTSRPRTTSGQILTAWIAKEELRTLLATVRARRRPPPDPAPTAPIPHLVHRLPDPRTAHPRHHRRRLVARDQRVRAAPASPTPAPRATTGWSNRSSASAAGSGIESISSHRIRFHCTRKARAVTQTSCCLISMRPLSVLGQAILPPRSAHCYGRRRPARCACADRRCRRRSMRLRA